MKNVYEVLRQKEQEQARVQREIECLQIVAPLLSEEKDKDAKEIGMAKAAAADSIAESVKRWP